MTTEPDNPTVATRPALTAAQQEVLARRLRAAASGREAQVPVIPRRAPSPTAALSHAQQRLWFLDQLQPGRPLYNMIYALRVRGPLNATALERSLGEIVRRHEILRTTFRPERGQPVQVIAPALEVRLRSVEAQSLPEAEREPQVLRLAEQEARATFTLETGPLFRAMLVRLSSSDHVLLLTFHHIVFDGWSEGVLRSELAALYEAFGAGRPSPLPEMSLQYADYACWNRERLRGEPAEKMLEYWKKRFAIAPAVLELPTDRPQPAVATSRGGAVELMLPAELKSKVQQLGRNRGATPFITLLAGFKALLHRYTGQTDVTVGAPMAMRSPVELEKLIGFFVNTLALRDDLSGNPTFGELVARVRQTVLEADANQELPFEKIVEVLRPARSTNQSPLFRVMFAMQNVAGGEWELPGLTVTRMDVFNQTAKFDLTLFLTDCAEGLKLVMEYNTDLFEAATVERMLAHYRNLLEGAVENPAARLSELPLLAEAETRRVLVEWNQTQTDYPRGRCIHELFEAQAERRPEAVALVLEHTHLTYRQLNSRANRLARELRVAGVERGTMVTICVEPSIEMVVGLLGILKAGGAYVPLAPEYPKDRLAFMLADTNSPVLLTQRRLTTHLPARETKTIFLDALEATPPENGDGTNLPSTTQPDDLAYVIYTSGTTGRPKGATIPHRGVVRLVKDTNYATFSADEVFLQFAPISFDASTFEIWGPLLNGGRLVIMPPAASSLQDLGQAIARHKVTTLWLTAGLFHLMTDERLSYLRPLRQLLVGGDVLSVSHVRKAFRELPGCRLINGYGPTESTTFACCHAITEGDLHGPSIPIGRPISNTQVYLLDANAAPVPVGVPGELYIGGDGLARGYLNLPELTREKFVRDPFNAEPTARLYRTGDLCRYRDDGAIEFLGRLDQQVKIRGFRIELEEIETVLHQHPGVRAVVVAARADTPGDKRLVAYFVGRAPASDFGAAGAPPTATPAALREYLKRRLPDYMLPSAFVALAALPLDANGKVDRKALPAPEAPVADAATAYAPPRSPVEELLAATWAEALGLERVGIHDNFFALGGHSLLAIQIIDRLNKAGLGLTLGQTLQYQTVAELAAVVNTNRTVESDSEDWFSLVTLQSHGEKPPLFLVHTAPGDVLGYMKLVYHLGNDQPCYGFQSLGLFRKEASHPSLEGMAAHYVKLLRRFQPRGPYYLGGWCFGGNVAMEMAQQLADAGAGVALLALMETWAHPPGLRMKNEAGRMKNPATDAARVSMLHSAFFILRYYLHHVRCLLRMGAWGLARFYGRKLKRLVNRGGKVAPRTDDEFAFETAKTGPLINREHVYEVNLRATRSYESRARIYPGKITLLRRAMYPTEEAVDPQAGFATLAREIEIRVVSGDHRGVLQEPHVKTLAKELKACLSRAQAGAKTES
ncbi:MAG: non-ribosomal peptide synthetase [Pedosphaera sp.]|nr:non-ribosomal peptide synthetase [Pedosphaera sp.]